MHRLVLLRHGESTWNRENRFTGWTDVDLSDKGRTEAAEAGRLAAVETVESEKLLALALRELGGQLPQIGQLTVTPDVLTGLVGRLK